jgi:predicted transcriptional regulator
MNFKEATNLLCEGLGHEDVAKMLHVSVQAVRQARLSPNAKAFRHAPQGWEGAILELARKRLAHYQRLVVQMEKVVSAAAR